jgi:hypothetical protein
MAIDPDGYKDVVVFGDAVKMGNIAKPLAGLL